jgi:hypothetical protein
MTDLLGIHSIEIWHKICRYYDAVNVAKLFQNGRGKLYSLEVGIN